MEFVKNILLDQNFYTWQYNFCFPPEINKIKLEHFNITLKIKKYKPIHILFKYFLLYVLFFLRAAKQRKVLSDLLSKKDNEVPVTEYTLHCILPGSP